MRRAALALTGFGASFCVFALMVLLNASPAGVSGISVPLLTLQPSDASAVPSETPEYVDSLPKADITLPYPIAGTPLVAEELAGYDGPFMEDGSDREVINAAALVLRNTGDAGVEQAIVILERGELRMTFAVSAVPPGAAVLAVEMRCQRCAQKNFTACYGWSVQSAETWRKPETVRVEAVGMGALTVTNLAETPLEQVRISYKTYYADSRLFIGGITYQIETGALAPGQTKRLQPGHYAAGQSQIVKVQTE